MRPLQDALCLGFATLVACADPEPPTDEAGDTGTEAGDGDGDGDPGDGDGDGDGDPQPPEIPPGACVSNAVLAEYSPGTLHMYVYEDGALARVIESGLPGSRALVRDDRIAVGGDEHVRVFSRVTGELTTDVLTAYATRPRRIDELGRVYFSGVLVDELDVVTKLGSFIPEGALAAGGWIPGVSSESQPNLGFYWPATHEFEPYLPTLPILSERANEHGQFELLAQGQAFVIADPNGEVVLPLLGSDGISSSVTAVVGPRRIVATFDENSQLLAQYRVDVETHEVLMIDPEPPLGFTYFPCSGDASLDSAGRVLLPVTDGAVVQVMRWDPSDESWTPLGRPYTQIGQIDIQHVGAGTLGDVFGVITLAPQTCEAAPAEWLPAPADAWIGQGQQIARVGAARSLMVEGSPIPDISGVDAAGSCVAWTDSFVDTSTTFGSLDDELPPVTLPTLLLDLD